MNTFLQQIGFADHFITELPISQNVFIKKMREVVDDANAKTFPKTGGIFSSKKNKLKGIITNNGFTIQQHRTLFGKDDVNPIAVGTFNEQNDCLHIEVKVNGFRTFFIFLYLFIVFWLVEVVRSTRNFPKLFGILWATLMVLLSFLGIWTGTKRLKKELLKAFDNALKAAEL